MKKTNSLLIALAVTATCGALTYGQTLSPRAEANKTRIVAGSTSASEIGKVSRVVLSPRAAANETRIVAQSAQDVDTLASIRNSTLSPRAQQQLGSGPQFQVALLGNKSAKGCGSDCCKK